ncbi:MAG: efflux RND transporter periplasmic adaptor subunit [Candidatus Eremiobacteraeota bacterium]|nr:efflux RND transporter periplasmic adaptor subunit [Candidatus Eremiobacteraeota bacterium]
MQYSVARLTSLLLAGVVALSLTACAKPMPKAQSGLPVSVEPAKRGDITATFTLTGVVAPRQQATLSSVASGNVLDVYVTLGQHVRAGQLLVKIDDSTLRAQAAQASAKLASVRANDVGGSSTAQANLASAKVAADNADVNLQRNQVLFKQGYVSKTALDQAQSAAASADAAYRAAQITAQNANLQSGNSSALADIQTAQAALDAIDAQIAQTNVTAPFDGIVTARSVDKGALASPGTALVTVSQLDPAWVNVGIPDDDLAYVHAGTPVTITIDTLPGRAWHANVDVVNAAASSGTLSYLTHLIVPNRDYGLRAGMVANVSIQQASHRGVIIVPRTAIYQAENGPAVYVVVDGKAKSVPVKSGLQTADRIEVSGIEPGAQVITQRPDSLQDGSVVSIVSPGAQTGPAPSDSRTSQ